MRSVLFTWCVLTGFFAALLGGTTEAEEKPSPAILAGTKEGELPSGAELLATVSQVVLNLQEYVRNRELTLVHNEDGILHLANGLYYLPTNAPALPKGMDKDSFLARFGQLREETTRMHLAADRGDQAELEKQLPSLLDAFRKFQALFPEATVKAGQRLAERFMCPMHPEEVGRRTNSCSKCGMELDQRVRVLPVHHPAAGRIFDQTITMAVRTNRPITVGQLAQIEIVLSKKAGGPVLPNDLIETHTQKIHLLIIDGTLEDYHHEHPSPTSTPGVYSFSFTLRKPGPYRIWADLRPSPMGVQEYVVADIPASGERGTVTNKSVNHSVTVGGLNYQLTLAQRNVRVGYPVKAQLRVTNPDGTEFTKLEPIMATFAHLVGFNEDYQTILHLHPKGPLITDPDARGGPELEFQFYALKPGFIRLFAQVQIDGQSKFAPFGLIVAP